MQGIRPSRDRHTPCRRRLYQFAATLNLFTQSKWGVGVALVPDLVDRLAAPLAHEESVWTVDDNSGYRTDIPVRMNDAFRNEHGRGIVGPRKERHAVSKSVRPGPIVPQS